MEQKWISNSLSKILISKYWVTEWQIRFKFVLIVSVLYYVFENACTYVCI